MTTIDHHDFPHIIDTIWSYMDFADILVARLACSDWRKRAGRRLQRHMEVRPHSNGIQLCTKDFREATETLKLPRYCLTRHMLARTRPLHPLAVASERWLSELFANLKVLDFEWTKLSGIAQQTFELLQQRLEPETMVRIDISYRARAPQVLPSVAIAGKTQVYTLDIGSRQGLCTTHTDKVIINLTCYTNASTPMCHADRFKIWNLLNPEELGDVDLVLTFSHDTPVQMYLPGALVFTSVYAGNLLTWLDTVGTSETSRSSALTACGQSSGNATCSASSLRSSLPRRRPTWASRRTGSQVGLQGRVPCASSRFWSTKMRSGTRRSGSTHCGTRSSSDPSALTSWIASELDRRLLNP